jgi:hypothetical protein
VYIKVINPKTDGKKKYNNSGSCIALVKYLSKEDEEKGLDKELYFANNRDMVTSQEVIKTIDNNCPLIAKGEARFYSIVIAPHPQEIEHLKSNKAELKKYTQEVMSLYAGCFNGRDGKNKNLKGDDLIWYGKIEYNRYYQGSDPEVKQGKVKQGARLPGDNTHIHVIVSRQDKNKTKKLSPLVNSKKLFYREQFKLKSCEHFDKEYNYQGAGKELEKRIIMRDGTIEQRMAHLEKEDQKRIAELYTHPPEQNQQTNQQQGKTKTRQNR